MKFHMFNKYSHHVASANALSTMAKRTLSLVHVSIINLLLKYPHLSHMKSIDIADFKKFK